MNYIIYDPSEVRTSLLPLTYTRPVGALRVGMYTMAERWALLLPGNYGWQTEDYLTELFPAVADPDIWIAGNVVADARLAAAVAALSPGERLVKGTRTIAWRGSDAVRDVEYDGEVIAVDKVYHIFGLNGRVLREDYAHLMAEGRKSQPLDASNTLIGDPSQIFIEEGATVLGSTLNTTTGPIYIGRHATVMEGCRLRGPICLGEHSQANMGTLIYPDTTIGPWCKVGGEINNVVMQGYSNKGHDGFLGNAVIGEWCNLGAGTTASNLKNDYTEIKLWDYSTHRFARTGLQFCGLIMGDHSKAAINTSFNTATVVGVGCNIVSVGMPRVFIPSFLRGGSTGFDELPLGEFFRTAERVMARRGIELTEAHRRMYTAVADYADRFK